MILISFLTINSLLKDLIFLEVLKNIQKFTYFSNYFTFYLIILKIIKKDEYIIL